jgi:beta-glucosidase
MNHVLRILYCVVGKDYEIRNTQYDPTSRNLKDKEIFMFKQNGRLALLLLLLTFLAACRDTPPVAPPVATDPTTAVAAYQNPDLPTADRVEDLLARMTLAEKVGQMTLVEKNSIEADDITALTIGGILSGGGGYPQPNTPESWAEMVDGFQAAALASRLEIPLIYGVDAVHGHSNVVGTVIFPHNVGLGAANDPDLIREIGRVTALEMIATGIYWNYAPVLAVPRDIRWGRTYEAYSENTEQVSRLATAFMRGLQGDDLAAADTALATPKHYVGDGGAVWGSSTTGNYRIDQGVTDVDEATLRAVHLPPYEAAIAAGARSIMISYTSWGGLKMHAHQYLITDVLRGELGFDGFIVADWAGVDQISNDYYTAVVTAMNAGIDMNMVPYDYQRFIETMLAAVENGDIAEARIDEAVRHILTVKFDLGLFERPYSDPSLLPLVGSAEHRALAREAVAKSLVLLKNEGGILPLAKETPLLLVGGPAADDVGIQSGGWTIEWQGRSGDITPGTTIIEAIEAAVSPETTVIYDRFGHFNDAPDDQSGVCLAVVGEPPYAEGQGDSADLRLPANDVRLLTRMAESCEQLVVVLLSGRPLIISDQLEAWDALVAAWLPGTEGQGVADVLFGDSPFSGTLPLTWPRSVEQLPFDFDNLDTADPLFPYGFGLVGDGQ